MKRKGRRGGGGGGPDWMEKKNTSADLHVRWAEGGNVFFSAHAGGSYLD